MSKYQIIWGGNYFTHYLPPSRCWLIWYKRDNLPRNSFADCELAWTSFDRNAQVFNSRWSRARQQRAKDRPPDAEGPGGDEVVRAGV